MKSRPLKAIVVSTKDGGAGGSRDNVCIPVQPYKALSRDVLLLLEFVKHEILEGFREGGSSELPVADFLYCVRRGIGTLGFWDYVHTLMLPVMSLLTGLKAAPPKTSNKVVRLSAASRN